MMKIVLRKKMYVDVDCIEDNNSNDNRETDDANNGV